VNKFNIGIIGQGFVGSAVREGLKNFYTIRTYDLSKELCNSTLEEVCKTSDIVFVCLPTPMRKDGSCDLRILESSLEEVETECNRNRDIVNPILVIKSTIPPGTTERLNNNSSLDICFSPEFLTEANSFEDFKNQTRIIIGGPRPATGVIKQMFRKPFPSIPIVKTGSHTAEMVKYFTNCFLATKVTFANEMYDICQALDIDFDKVTEYVLHDSRIGNSHLMVPGPDGDHGWGGHCVPGDRSVRLSAGESISFEDLFENFEKSNNKYLIESTDFEISSKDIKTIKSVECNNFDGAMYTFEFYDNNVLKTFECTDNHLIPVTRNGVHLLIEAKYINKEDELFIDIKNEYHFKLNEDKFKLLEEQHPKIKIKLLFKKELRELGIEIK